MIKVKKSLFKLEYFNKSLLLSSKSILEVFLENISENFVLSSGGSSTQAEFTLTHLSQKTDDLAAEHSYYFVIPYSNPMKKVVSPSFYRIDKTEKHELSKNEGNPFKKILAFRMIFLKRSS